jgi:hypothetical protein
MVLVVQAEEWNNSRSPQEFVPIKKDLAQEMGDLLVTAISDQQTGTPRTPVWEHTDEVNHGRPWPRRAQENSEQC